MNSAINVREAELMEVIRINNREIKLLEEENKKLKEFNIELNGEYKNSLKQIKEISNNYNELKEENSKLKVESEELKMWLREKLPLDLLKEYMNKFEGVDLKNV